VNFKKNEKKSLIKTLKKKILEEKTEMKKRVCVCRQLAPQLISE